MLTGVLVFGSALFVLAAACYLLFVTSEPLEQVGGRIGQLLHLPEDVIASTFQALATSGPEIVMAILAATPFVGASVWNTLALGEKACSGCLNMCFSAMDNLLGIGCLGMIFMLYKGTVKREEVIKVEPSVKIGLMFYILSSLCLCLFITTSFHTKVLLNVREVKPDGTVVERREAIDEGAEVKAEEQLPNGTRVLRQVEKKVTASWLSELQSWILMIIGIVFVLSQFFIPAQLDRIKQRQIEAGILEAEEEEEEEEEGAALPTTAVGWFSALVKSGFIYAFLVFALIVFVRECLGATFNMATVGIVSVGGVLIMFTSYVSSFPEFMMTYRYAVANKKSALLGMLFGSNVIDLAFAGFRAIWRHEPMAVYTTGRFQQLFPFYLWSLPLIAVLAFLGIWTGKFKYKHAYPLVVFYVIYIVSGFVLL